MLKPPSTTPTCSRRKLRWSIWPRMGCRCSSGKNFRPPARSISSSSCRGQALSVRLSGQVVWQDWNGRAGIQFVDVPKASRRLLTEFLSANAARRILTGAAARRDRRSGRASAVGHCVGLRADARQPQRSSTAYEAVPKQSSSAKSDADNRRLQARYACRLGAEVYRTGTNVPNHCCLTDLSSGGCYLEVTLPFAPGSSVEIVVRTYGI